MFCYFRILNSIHWFLKMERDLQSWVRCHQAPGECEDSYEVRTTQAFTQLSPMKLTVNAPGALCFLNLATTCFFWTFFNLHTTLWSTQDTFTPTYIHKGQVTRFWIYLHRLNGLTNSPPCATKLSIVYPNLPPYRDTPNLVKLCYYYWLLQWPQTPNPTSSQ